MSHAATRAARAAAVPAWRLGSVLVQAPAGSGKTTLLAQRYLRLLAAVDAPERILALTFTRRAAEEMRERVIAALQAGSAGRRVPPDVNPETWELAAAAKRRLDALRIDVERHPSRLRIETIDSFNAWLAAQLPITSGAGGRLASHRGCRSRCMRRPRARALAHEEADSFGRAVERVLAVGDQRWRQLVGNDRRHAARAGIAGCRCWWGTCRRRARSERRSSSGCGGTSTRISHSW